MPSRSPGPFLRFLRGIWTTLNFARKLVLNLLFFGIVIAIFVAVASQRHPVKDRTTLILDLEGALVEQYSTDPTARLLAGIGSSQRKEMQLRDLLRAVDRAASDPRIERMVLIPDELTAAGFASLREIGAALERFRAAGKEIITVSGGMDQRQYLLAAHTSRILLDPDGAVLLEGLANYRNYYREALEKIGVDVHLIRVGTYKSAGEPFILDQASDAAKEADAYWMNGVWQEYLDEVAQARELDAAGLADEIARYDQLVTAHHGDLAALALEQKLVDELATRLDARALLRAKGVAEGSDGFRQINLDDYLAALGPEPPAPGVAQVAVIVAEGNIVQGEQPPGSIGGQSTAQLVRSAREDDSVKAIVLRVNSPGGDAYASELIRRELAQARSAGKPVVVSMGDVAASGGYWISMASDEIWAQPSTITGSIGIFGLFVSVPDTLAKLGVHTDGVGTTPLAGAFDQRRPMSPQVEAILSSVIGRGYAQFIGKVAEARGKTPDEINAIAQGRVWDGSQAFARGLVDHLGGLREAIAAAAERAELGADYRVHYVERELNVFERAMLNLGNSESVARALRRVGLALPPGTAAAVAAAHSFGELLEPLGGRPWGALAHCLCEAR